SNWCIKLNERIRKLSIAGRLRYYFSFYGQYYIFCCVCCYSSGLVEYTGSCCIECDLYIPLLTGCNGVPGIIRYRAPAGGEYSVDQQRIISRINKIKTMRYGRILFDLTKIKL